MLVLLLVYSCASTPVAGLTGAVCTGVVATETLACVYVRCSVENPIIFLLSYTHIQPKGICDSNESREITPQNEENA